MESNNFDDILGAARQSNPKIGEESPRSPSGKNNSPWDDLTPPEREATVRLNVDIPINLNDRLAAKARALRKPKTELVRRLLEWALDESNE